MKDRIRELMEAMHMSQQTFAQYIDMSPASLSSIFNGRTRPTLNIVEAIKKKCPKVNTDWLMFGKGEMYDAPDGSAGADEADKRGNEPRSASPMAETEPTLSFADDNVAQKPSPQRTRRGSEHDKPSMTDAESDFSQLRDTLIREAIAIEHPKRHVTEIRVYYDDQTYETFAPSK